MYVTTQNICDFYKTYAFYLQKFNIHITKIINQDKQE